MKANGHNIKIFGFSTLLLAALALYVNASKEPIKARPIANVSQSPQWDSLQIGNFGRYATVDGTGFKNVVWKEFFEFDSDNNSEDGTYGLIFFAQKYSTNPWQKMGALVGPSKTVGLPSIASYGNKIVIVWSDDANGTISVKRGERLVSSPGQVQWQPVFSFPVNETPTSIPTVVAAMDENNVYLSWVDKRLNHSEVFFAQVDQQNNVSLATRISDNGNTSSWTPSISVAGGYIHLAFLDNENGGLCQPDCRQGVDPGCGVCAEEVMYRRRAVDNGEWEDLVQVTCNDPNKEEKSWAPSIAAIEDQVHLVYFEDQHEPINPIRNFEVYHKQSANGGNSGLACDNEATKLSNGFSDFTSHWRPVVDVDRQGDAHVVWHGVFDENFSMTSAAILSRRQLNGAWQEMDILAYTPNIDAWSSAPSIAVSADGRELSVGFQHKVPDSPSEILYLIRSY